MERINVLIVDDSGYNLLITEMYLKQMKTFSFNIAKATNGQKALNTFIARNSY